MTRKIIILVIVFALALVITMPAFACEDWECSPGYWKNHVEDWCAEVNDGSCFDDWSYDDLDHGRTDPKRMG
mgnify:CR=1 FL=1